MPKPQYKKVTFEFPADEYVFLRMACAKQGVTMKEFITSSVMKNIEEYECELDSKALAEITEQDREESISWDEMEKRIGWDKL